jgi:eukaryotic-like serine/threonine-protein kinase
MSNSPQAKPSTPSQLLEGTTLPSGWKLVERVPRQAGGTGSNFGTGYRAMRANAGRTEKAFVKAIDFVRAMTAVDPIAELLKLTSEATFEREAMELCDEHRMSRLVKLIGWEYINQDPALDPMKRVLCLVMESGEGDIRRQIGHIGQLSTSVILHVLEDAALGVAQLHRRGLAHQDVKPSNVISMTDMKEVAGNLFKVADLGRVVRKDKPGPYDQYSWPGDGHYAPTERWYAYHPQQRPDLRESSDAYMLGSLACFLFCGVPMQPLLFKDLPASMEPGNWTGTYNESLVQVLRSLQFNIISSKVAPAVHTAVRDGVVGVVKELLEPDPLKRGDKRARAQTGAPGLDRFHTRFRLLRLRAAVAEKFISS